MQERQEKMLKDAKIPGMGVSITSSEGVTTAHGVGVTSAAAPEAVTKDTIFEAASLTKPVFAYLVIKLAQEGRLNLDLPLHEYGDFGPDELQSAVQYRELTARKILSHQAGLPNFFNPDKGIPVAYIADVGQEFNYSGEGYSFLQQVVENIIKPQTLEKFAREEFATLGMTHTSLMPPTGCSLLKLEADEAPPSAERLDALLETQAGVIGAGDQLFTAEKKGGLWEIKPLNPTLDDEQIQYLKDAFQRLPGIPFLRPVEAFELPLITAVLGDRPKDCAPSIAVGHTEDGVTTTEQHFYNVHAAGSLYTTAEDYGKFLHHCATDDYVSTEMFSPAVPGLSLRDRDTKAMGKGVDPDVLEQITWGVGIGIQQTSDGRRVAFHWGDNDTGRNFAAIDLVSKQSVVCLTNSANGPSVFQDIVEPVVGSIAPVAQWLSGSEGLAFGDRMGLESVHSVETTLMKGPYITEEDLSLARERMEKFRQEMPLMGGGAASLPDPASQEDEKKDDSLITPMTLTSLNPQKEGGDKKKEEELEANPIVCMKCGASGHSSGSCIRPKKPG